MMEQVKKWGNNKDSILVLITKIFAQTNDFLAKNNRTKVAVMVASGAFAEGMYLACSLGEVAKDNTKIMAIVAGQKENHMKLLTVLDAYNADEAMKPVLTGIQNLKPIWGNFNIESGKKMDQKNVAAVSDIAEAVRNAFVQ
jgi:hypothetical protein